MKKLLITTLAAVSVGLCAKAEDTGFISGTSFEGLTEGAVFSPTDTYWTLPTNTDDVFKITNVTYSTDATPQHWDLTTGEMALAIDTANPILRNVNPVPQDDTTIINPPQDVTTPVFFDSVVQFTATDVAPSMENNTTDKLAVWLYTSPDDVSATNPGLFGETSPITSVAITAGYLDGATLKTKNYITNIEVEPDTWHRLTIKSFVKSGRPWYSVWVDKTPVDGKADINAEEGLTEFLSMVSDAVNNDTYTKLQGVAFDGKGAVDDIVFTTTDPFAVPSYTVTTSVSDVEGAVLRAEYKLDSGEYNELALSGTLTLPETTTDFTAKLWISDGAKLVGGTKNADEEDNGNYAWYISYDAATFKKDGTDTITFEVVADGGTEDPITTYAVSVTPNAQATVDGLSAEYAEGNVVTFTVVAATGYTIESVVVAGASTRPDLTPSGNGYSFTMPAEAVTITVTTKAIEEEVTYPSVGGVETPEYSDKAKAAIDAAFPENSYPDGLTVKVNGETLTGAPAVAMLNDAVEMFILADDAKFFDEDGVMDISFKATGADPEDVAYEAKVGGLAATVNETSYEVVPKYIDIAKNTELQAKPEGTVTFRLVIQKK